MTWGDEKSYTGYQYCFKLTVGTATIESEKENIQINGVTPSWMPDGEHISCYKNQQMIIVDKTGTSVDEIPLNGIMDESVISFMYSFSPDGKLFATANGIVDREGNVMSAGFPSNGVDRKSQGLMLKSIGWLDEDTAYVVDRLSITLYSVSTDTYRNATPGLADAFKQYPQYNQVYLEAVLLYYPYDALYKIWRHDSKLFYVGRREINDSYLAEDIFALTPDGESRIAQGNRDMGHEKILVGYWFWQQIEGMVCQIGKSKLSG